MDQSQSLQSRSQDTNALIAVHRSPGDPLALHKLAELRSRAGRSDAADRVVSWCYYAFANLGTQRRNRFHNEITDLVRLVSSTSQRLDRPDTIARLARQFPLNPNTWLGQAKLPADGRQTGSVDRALKRALVLAPYATAPYLARGRWLTSSGRKPEAVTPLRRCTMLQPGSDRYHYQLADALIAELTVDGFPPRALTNALRRAIALDPTTYLRSPYTALWYRNIGDADAMAKATDRRALLEAKQGLDQNRGRSVAWFDHFRRIVIDLEPLEVHRDFPAQVLNSRVLIQPRLPDDGPWVLLGPAEHVERARRILAYVNPTATIVEPSDPRATSARKLSLMPSDDPDCWYLPCLYGHWHVYWTVLPAILDASGHPDIERMLAYCIRTRQFVQFWYSKGHEHHYLRNNLALGKSIADRMADEASRLNYMRTLAADHKEYIRDFFSNICHRVQYFNYAVYRPGDVVLNMGVSEGFEIPAYLALISPGGVLHNIDPEGYDVLGEPARQWIEGSHSEVVLHRVALTDKNGEIEMETGGCWEDARISKRQIGRRRIIPAQRLDTFIAEQGLDRIDHIKLDIEGGEGFLLDQLIDVMRTHRPQIEISIYHTVEQFFEIPDRMMRESEGYDFFFYHYCGHFGEGTLYAIPKEITPELPVRPAS